ncbi:MAG: hypothetical protein HN729_12740 [Candidatus Marinimicrobia bacterium]|jgi:hypothetical protein|nr:hypothetical protein [Candidatus Neomarinimicrobiota bacterium]MBT3634656.1 hypothetical protein [Candidatus Neomarinimicrobiota bacterium]MBT3682714.1 hypothetical protein [Candidatus Neomarinimicrobiota bacterium]MBT3759631.1 hypothetical protein [Candidatus Neomarinimicrobiota bacterium]MBT3894497.1 hypothetical protein [Candidatus Neomarinimicrobiota bacterium]
MISKRLIIFCMLILHFLIGQESYIDSTKIKDPKLAWKLGFVPGLGQVYNGKYIKASGLIGAQVYAVSKFNGYAKNDNITKRNTYGWWIFGLYVMGILDAYVDAQLSTFPQKLPDGDTDIIIPDVEPLKEELDE